MRKVILLEPVVPGVVEGDGEGGVGAAGSWAVGESNKERALVCAIDLESSVRGGRNVNIHRSASEGSRAEGAVHDTGILELGRVGR